MNKKEYAFGPYAYINAKGQLVVRLARPLKEAKP